MLKKSLFVLVIFTFYNISIFASPGFNLRFGGGGYFTSDFGGGVEVTAEGFGNVGEIKTPYAGGGIFSFLDAKFIELSYGFFFAGGKWEEKEYVTFLNENYNIFIIGSDIGILGKIPISLNERLSFFPIFGINYRSISTALFNGELVSDANKINSLWFKFGVGMDSSLGGNLFLRLNALYGVRLENKFEREMASLFESIAPGIAKTNNLRGHGLELKFALGRMF